MPSDGVRAWTTVGVEEVDGDETREAFSRAVVALVWMDVSQGQELTVGAIPGLNITEIIRELRIPKVSAVAISNQLAPYGLYGIEGNYKNGRARVYVIDRGSDCLPIASDFWSKERETTHAEA